LTIGQIAFSIPWDKLSKLFPTIPNEFNLGNIVGGETNLEAEQKLVFEQGSPGVQPRLRMIRIQAFTQTCVEVDGRTLTVLPENLSGVQVLPTQRIDQTLFDQLFRIFFQGFLAFRVRKNYC